MSALGAAAGRVPRLRGAATVEGSPAEGGRVPRLRGAATVEGSPGDAGFLRAGDRGSPLADGPRPPLPGDRRSLPHE